jgi:uncharacterized membrane protein
VLATRGKDSAATKEMAPSKDNSRVAADTVLVGASVASLVGVVFAPSQGRRRNRDGSYSDHRRCVSQHRALLVFRSHRLHVAYARLYYSAGGDIDWHAHDLPDFGDFAYVALTLGMTFQVSDTDIIAKPIRKAALRPAVLSYVFGVAILATTINVVASLLAK